MPTLKISYTDDSGQGEEKAFTLSDQGIVRLDILRDGNPNNADSYLYADHQFAKMLEINYAPVRNLEMIKDKSKIVTDALAYFWSLAKDDGSFVYRRDVKKFKNFTGYNIARHSNAIWGILVTSARFNIEIDQAKIRKSIDFVLERSLIRNGEQLFCRSNIDANADIHVCGPALFLLALAAYHEILQDSQYDEIMRQLAHGLISLQEDGEYWQLLDKDGNKKEKQVVTWYNGEINLALSRYYKVTSDPAAKTALENFFTKSSRPDAEWLDDDSWLMYIANEILDTGYHTSDNALNLLVQNLVNNYEMVSRRFGMVGMEYLANGLVFLQSLIDRYDEFSAQLSYSRERLQRIWENVHQACLVRMQRSLRYYGLPENVAHFERPQDVLGAYYDTEYESIIDDTYHNMLGYGLFVKNEYK